jgi:hypothetical protein
MQEGLEARVERLEGENRWLKRRTVMVLALVGGVLIMGQSPAPKVLDVLKARRLEIVDSAGKPTAILQATDEGPSLVLLDSAGVRAALFVPKHQPVLGLYGKGEYAAVLTVEGDGPHLVLSGGSGVTWRAP